MEEFSVFIEWVWAPVVALLAWMLNKQQNMNERLVKVEAIAVGTEIIRAIIKDEVSHLHEDIEGIRNSVDELGRNVARRRREDAVD